MCVQCVVVWDVAQRAPLCSHKVGTGKSGPGRVVTWVHQDTFMVGGQVRHHHYLKEDWLLSVLQGWVLTATSSAPPICNISL